MTSGNKSNIQVFVCALVGIWVCVAVGEVWADEVHHENRVYREVSIRSFDGEFVIFNMPNGDAVAKKLAEISAIYADTVRGLDEFNRAERHYRKGEFRLDQPRYLTSLPR